MRALPKDVYRQMAGNNRKLVGLILLFPVALSAFVCLFLKLFEWIYYQEATSNSVGAHYNVDPLITAENIVVILLYVVMIACIMTLFSFLKGKDVILHLAGAKLCPDDKEHIKIYHAVENVALAAGIPTPKVYLIQDKALNAFATGYSPQNAAITLTTGLVERLEPLELEAVIAHEMGHILNRDIRLNLFIITGIGVIGLIGEMLLRIRFRSNGRSSRGKGNGLIIVVIAVGLALYLFRYFVAPFIHMAVSRTQEFQADATSAFLTRNPQALADALAKISENPQVTRLQDTKEMAAMCIFSPLKRAAHLLDTHPPIKDRIERLEQMS